LSSRDPILTSAIKNPVLLIEGKSKRFVEKDCIMFKPDGGREIFCEQLPSQQVRTNPRKVIGRDGKAFTEYDRVTVRVARRKSAPPELFGGLSSRMSPGDKLIENFADGVDRTRKLFNERKSYRWRSGVSREVFMQTPERAILFFPKEGQLTSRGLNAGPKVKIVVETAEGWQVKDASGWTLITEREARELLDSGQGYSPA